METPEKKQKHTLVKRIKGTQDILDATLRDYVLQKFYDHLAVYNFEHIVTPILEPLELFKRTLGTETDVVSKEMYLVEPSSDKNTICLRPEGTASIMRTFLEHSIATTPWKVFSYGPMFRHERPQLGRYREFYQISIETIGTESIRQDAHMITMLDRFFSERLPLDNYALLINFIGCAADRVRFKQTLDQFLATVDEQICATCVVRRAKNILRIFDCKNEACKVAYQDAPKIIESLCDGCNAEWRLLQEELQHLSISYSIDPLLVRGLDYYEKTVFEFVGLTALGSQNTFCGGGRYNTLATELGAKQDYPSIGAGIGIERLLLLLEAKKHDINFPKKPLFVIVPYTEEQQSLSLLIADELQAHDMRVDIMLETASMKSRMRKASKLDAQFVIIIGPEEQAARKVTFKDMVTGHEQQVDQAGLVQFVCQLKPDIS